MILPVTFTTISVFAILLIPLTGWVGLLRGETGILRGDGGHPVLFKRIRIYGNLTEVFPFFVFALGAAESAGLSMGWLWAAVVCFLVGRVLHYGLYDTKMRGGAMLVTVLPGVVMGIWLLGQIWV